MDLPNDQADACAQARTPQRGVFVHPGGHYFGVAPCSIDTLLGSCVSVTVWHPVRHVGGLCHALLPTRQRPAGAVLDGRFADEAIGILLRHLRAWHILPQSCQIQVFGGGRMFTAPELKGLDVGPRNVAVVFQVLNQLGLNVVHADVGGVLPRRLHFDLQTGTVVHPPGQPVPKELL